MTFTVRKNLEVAQRRYKKTYDERVNTVNQALGFGYRVYGHNQGKDRKKLDQNVEGVYRILKNEGHTFTVLAKGFLDRASSDHVVRAPTPAG